MKSLSRFQLLLLLGAGSIVAGYILDKLYSLEEPSFACLPEHAEADEPCICGKVGTIRQHMGEVIVDYYAGLSGVTIRATGDGTSAEAISDARGAYQIRLTGPDMYLVEASVGDDLFLGSTFAVLASDDKPQRCLEASFPIPASGLLRGRLLYSDGTPAIEPDLFLYEASSKNRFYQWRIWRDRAGRFAISRVPAGWYAVGVNPVPALEVAQPNSLFFPGGVAGDEMKLIVIAGSRVDLGDLVIERPH